MKLLFTLFSAITVFFSALSSAAKLHPVRQAFKPCYNSCRFRFCDYKIHFKIGEQHGMAFTGAICSNLGTRIGLVKTTGEAYVFDGRNVVKLSKWLPKGLNKLFSATFFKSYTLHDQNLSGIGHEEMKKNQLWFLNNRCFVLPLTSYQVLHRFGYVVGVKHPKGSPFLDCVEFITHTPSQAARPPGHHKKFGRIHGNKF